MAPSRSSRHLARRTIAIVLVVLTALLAPLAVTAVWLHERIMSTDGWVETVAPLEIGRAHV